MPGLKAGETVHFVEHGIGHCKEDCFSCVQPSNLKDVALTASLFPGIILVLVETEHRLVLCNLERRWPLANPNRDPNNRRKPALFTAHALRIKFVVLSGGTEMVEFCSKNGNRRSDFWVLDTNHGSE